MATEGELSEAVLKKPLQEETGELSGRQCPGPPKLEKQSSRNSTGYAALDVDEEVTSVASQDMTKVGDGGNIDCGALGTTGNRSIVQDSSEGSKAVHLIGVGNLDCSEGEDFTKSPSNVQVSSEETSKDPSTSLDEEKQLEIGKETKKSDILLQNKKSDILLQNDQIEEIEQKDESNSSEAKEKDICDTTFVRQQSAEWSPDNEKEAKVQHATAWELESEECTTGNNVKQIPPLAMKVLDSLNLQKENPVNEMMFSKDNLKIEAYSKIAVYEINKETTNEHVDSLCEKVETIETMRNVEHETSVEKIEGEETGQVELLDRVQQKGKGIPDNNFSKSIHLDTEIGENTSTGALVGQRSLDKGKNTDSGSEDGGYLEGDKRNDEMVRNDEVVGQNEYALITHDKCDSPSTAKTIHEQNEKEQENFEESINLERKTESKVVNNDDKFVTESDEMISLQNIEEVTDLINPKSNEAGEISPLTENEERLSKQYPHVTSGQEALEELHTQEKEKEKYVYLLSDKHIPEATSECDNIEMKIDEHANYSWSNEEKVVTEINETINQANDGNLETSILRGDSAGESLSEDQAEEKSGDNTHLLLEGISIDAVEEKIRSGEEHENMGKSFDFLSVKETLEDTTLQKYKREMNNMKSPGPPLEEHEHESDENESKEKENEKEQTIQMTDLDNKSEAHKTARIEEGLWKDEEKRLEGYSCVALEGIGHKIFKDQDSTTQESEAKVYTSVCDTSALQQFPDETVKDVMCSYETDKASDIGQEENTDIGNMHIEKIEAESCTEENETEKHFLAHKTPETQKHENHSLLDDEMQGKDTTSIQMCMKTEDTCSGVKENNKNSGEDEEQHNAHQDNSTSMVPHVTNLQIDENKTECTEEGSIQTDDAIPQVEDIGEKGETNGMLKLKTVPGENDETIITNIDPDDEKIKVAEPQPTFGRAEEKGAASVTNLTENFEQKRDQKIPSMVSKDAGGSTDEHGQNKSSSEMEVYVQDTSKNDRELDEETPKSEGRYLCEDHKLEHEKKVSKTIDAERTPEKAIVREDETVVCHEHLSFNKSQEIISLSEEMMNEETAETSSSAQSTEEKSHLNEHQENEKLAATAEMIQEQDKIHEVKDLYEVDGQANECNTPWESDSHTEESSKKVGADYEPSQADTQEDASLTTLEPSTWEKINGGAPKSNTEECKYTVQYEEGNLKATSQSDEGDNQKLDNYLEPLPSGDEAAGGTNTEKEHIHKEANYSKVLEEASTQEEEKEGDKLEGEADEQIADEEVITETIASSKIENLSEETKNVHIKKEKRQDEIVLEQENKRTEEENKTHEEHLGESNAILPVTHESVKENLEEVSIMQKEVPRSDTEEAIHETANIHVTMEIRCKNHEKLPSELQATFGSKEENESASDTHLQEQVQHKRDQEVSSTVSKDGGGSTDEETQNKCHSEIELCMHDISKDVRKLDVQDNEIVIPREHLYFDKNQEIISSVGNDIRQEGTTDAIIFETTSSAQPTEEKHLLNEHQENEKLAARAETIQEEDQLHKDMDQYEVDSQAPQASDSQAEESSEKIGADYKLSQTDTENSLTTIEISEKRNQGAPKTNTEKHRPMGGDEEGNFKAVTQSDESDGQKVYYHHQSLSFKDDAVGGLTHTERERIYKETKCSKMLETNTLREKKEGDELEEEADKQRLSDREGSKPENLGEETENVNIKREKSQDGVVPEHENRGTNDFKEENIINEEHTDQSNASLPATHGSVEEAQEEVGNMQTEAPRFDTEEAVHETTNIHMAKETRCKKHEKPPTDLQATIWRTEENKSSSDTHLSEQVEHQRDQEVSSTESKDAGEGEEEDAQTKCCSETELHSQYISKNTRELDVQNDEIVISQEPISCSKTQEIITLVGDDALNERTTDAIKLENSPSTQSTEEKCLLNEHQENEKLAETAEMILEEEQFHRDRNQYEVDSQANECNIPQESDFQVEGSSNKIDADYEPSQTDTQEDASLSTIESSGRIKMDEGVPKPNKEKCKDAAGYEEQILKEATYTEKEHTYEESNCSKMQETNTQEEDKEGDKLEEEADEQISDDQKSSKLENLNEEATNAGTNKERSQDVIVLEQKNNRTNNLKEENMTNEEHPGKSNTPFSVTQESVEETLEEEVGIMQKEAPRSDSEEAIHESTNIHMTIEARCKNLEKSPAEFQAMHGIEEENVSSSNTCLKEHVEPDRDQEAMSRVPKDAEDAQNKNCSEIQLHVQDTSKDDRELDVKNDEIVMPHECPSFNKNQEIKAQVGDNVLKEGTTDAIMFEASSSAQPADEKCLLDEHQENEKLAATANMVQEEDQFHEDMNLFQVDTQANKSNNQWAPDSQSEESSGKKGTDYKPSQAGTQEDSSLTAIETSDREKRNHGAPKSNTEKHKHMVDHEDGILKAVTQSDQRDGQKLDNLHEPLTFEDDAAEGRTYSKIVETNTQQEEREGDKLKEEADEQISDDQEVSKLENLSKETIKKDKRQDGIVPEEENKSTNDFKEEDITNEEHKDNSNALLSVTHESVKEIVEEEVGMMQKEIPSFDTEEVINETTDIHMTPETKGENDERFPADKEIDVERPESNGRPPCQGNKLEHDKTVSKTTDAGRNSDKVIVWEDEPVVSHEHLAFNKNQEIISSVGDNVLDEGTIEAIKFVASSSAQSKEEKHLLNEHQENEKLAATAEMLQEEDKDLHNMGSQVNKCNTLWESDSHAEGSSKRKGIDYEPCQTDTREDGSLTIESSAREKANQEDPKSDNEKCINAGVYEGENLEAVTQSDKVDGQKLDNHLEPLSFGDEAAGGGAYTEKERIYNEPNCSGILETNTKEEEQEGDEIEEEADEQIPVNHKDSKLEDLSEETKNARAKKEKSQDSTVPEQENKGSNDLKEEGIPYEKHADKSNALLPVPHESAEETLEEVGIMQKEDSRSDTEEVINKTTVIEMTTRTKCENYENLPKSLLSDQDHDVTTDRESTEDGTQGYNAQLDKGTLSSLDREQTHQRKKDDESWERNMEVPSVAGTEMQVDNKIGDKQCQESSISEYEWTYKTEEETCMQVLEASRANDMKILAEDAANNVPQTHESSTKQPEKPFAAMKEVELATEKEHNGYVEEEIFVKQERSFQEEVRLDRNLEEVVADTHPRNETEKMADRIELDMASETNIVHESNPHDNARNLPVIHELTITAINAEEDQMNEAITFICVEKMHGITKREEKTEDDATTENEKYTEGTEGEPGDRNHEMADETGVTTTKNSDSHPSQIFEDETLKKVVSLVEAQVHKDKETEMSENTHNQTLKEDGTGDKEESVSILEQNILEEEKVEKDSELACKERPEIVSVHNMEEESGKQENSLISIEQHSSTASMEVEMPAEDVNTEKQTIKEEGASKGIKTISVSDVKLEQSFKEGEIKPKCEEEACETEANNLGKVTEKVETDIIPVIQGLKQMADKESTKDIILEINATKRSSHEDHSDGQISEYEKILCNVDSEKELASIHLQGNQRNTANESNIAPKTITENKEVEVSDFQMMDTKSEAIVETEQVKVELPEDDEIHNKSDGNQNAKTTGSYEEAIPNHEKLLATEISDVETSSDDYGNHIETGGLSSSQHRNDKDPCLTLSESGKDMHLKEHMEDNEDTKENILEKEVSTAVRELASISGVTEERFQDQEKREKGFEEAKAKQECEPTSSKANKIPTRHVQESESVLSRHNLEATDSEESMKVVSPQMACNKVEKATDLLAEGLSHEVFGDEQHIKFEVEAAGGEESIDEVEGLETISADSETSDTGNTSNLKDECSPAANTNPLVKWVIGETTVHAQDAEQEAEVCHSPVKEQSVENTNTQEAEEYEQLPKPNPVLMSLFKKEEIMKTRDEVPSINLHLSSHIDASDEEITTEEMNKEFITSRKNVSSASDDFSGAEISDKTKDFKMASADLLSTTIIDTANAEELSAPFVTMSLGEAMGQQGDRKERAEDFSLVSSENTIQNTSSNEDKESNSEFFEHSLEMMGSKEEIEAKEHWNKEQNTSSATELTANGTTKAEVRDKFEKSYDSPLEAPRDEGIISYEKKITTLTPINKCLEEDLIKVAKPETVYTDSEHTVINDVADAKDKLSQDIPSISIATEVEGDTTLYNERKKENIDSDESVLSSGATVGNASFHKAKENDNEPINQDLEIFVSSEKLETKEAGGEGTCRDVRVLSASEVSNEESKFVKPIDVPKTTSGALLETTIHEDIISDEENKNFSLEGISNASGSAEAQNIETTSCPASINITSITNQKYGSISDVSHCASTINRDLGDAAAYNVEERPQSEASNVAFNEQIFKNADSHEIIMSEKQSELLVYKQVPVEEKLPVEERGVRKTKEDENQELAQFETSQSDQDKEMDVSYLPVSQFLRGITMREADDKSQAMIQEEDIEDGHEGVGNKKRQGLGLPSDEHTRVEECISQNTTEVPKSCSAQEFVHNTDEVEPNRNLSSLPDMETLAEDAEKEVFMSENLTDVVPKADVKHATTEQSGTQSELKNGEFISLGRMNNEKSNGAAEPTEQKGTLHDNEALIKNPDTPSVAKTDNNNMLQDEGCQNFVEAKEIQSSTEMLEKAMIVDHPPEAMVVIKTKNFIETDKTLSNAQKSSMPVLEANQVFEGALESAQEGKGINTQIDYKHFGHIDAQMDSTVRGPIDTANLSDSGKALPSDSEKDSMDSRNQIAENILEKESLTINRDKFNKDATDMQVDEAKSDEEDGKDEQEHEINKSGTDAPVTVETRDEEPKTAHKKSHNILSGVKSKVKHSIAKVKKAITGKSSHSKTVPPK